MPTVRALRGVCVGPESHLAIGETAEVDRGTAQFLIAIGAVEEYTAPVDVPVQPAPVKAGKAKE